MLENLPVSLTQGHCVIAIENYGSEHCGDASATPSTPDGQPEQVPIEYPEGLADIPSYRISEIPNIQYVVLRNSSTIVDPRLLGQDGPVLLVSRINLNNLDQSVVNNPEIRSLLLTEEGTVHYATEHNITYRSGYFQATDQYDENRASGRLSEDKARALGPIAGAKVFSSYDVTERFASVTDGDGAFRVEYYLPGCPCTSRSYDGDLWAEIPYNNKNEQKRQAT